MKLLISILLLTITIASISCDSNETYVMLEKKSGLNAKAESFTISNATHVVYESPIFEDHSLVSLEACLPKSMNDTYELTLLQSKQSRWDDGSYLVIRGTYDNIVFKNNMLRSTKEVHAISLHYAIHMYPIVRFAHLSVPDDWMLPTYNDEDWDQEALGSIPYSREGTQYFRKDFKAIPNMASYELKLFYQFGIVVYMNGIEVFRDHLPEDTITSQTTSIGQYDQLSYHSVFRSARDFASDTVVLCIEEHYPDLTQHKITMDFWLAEYAPSLSTRPCSVIPVQPLLTASPSVESIESILNYNLHTQLTSLPLPLTLIAQFNTSFFPQVNGVQFYTSSFSTESPTTYSLFTSNETRLLVQSDRLDPHDHTYSTSVSPIVEETYSSFTLQITSTSSSKLSLSQLQFLTCSLPKPATIEFQQTSYVFSQYAPIRIQPKYGGFYDCSIQPALPSGLSLNPDLCIIEGKIKEIMDSVTYRVFTSQDGGYSGTFSLSVEKGYCMDGEDRIDIHQTEMKDCKGKNGSIVWGHRIVECMVVGDSLELLSSEQNCYRISIAWIVALLLILTVVVIGIFLYKKHIVKPLENEEFHVNLVLIVFSKYFNKGEYEIKY